MGKSIFMKVRQYGHLLVYPVIVATLIYMSNIVERYNLTRELSAQQFEVGNVAAELRLGLEQEITSKMLLAQGLSAILSVEPYMDQTKFEKLAKLLQQRDPSIVNIAALQGYVVARVYPYEENKGILGNDIRNAGHQGDMAALSVVQRSPIIDGPVNLMQGGQGFIVRSPVFLADDGSFWGFATVVVDADQFIQKAGLTSAPPGFEFAVRRKYANGAMEPPFIGSAALFDSKSIFESIDRPTGKWVIAVAPAGGWATHSKSLVVNRVFFSLLGLLLMLLVWYLRRQRILATKAHDRLMDAVEALPAGFVLYDENGRLQSFNRAFCDIYDKCAPAVKIGATSEEIIRYGLARGQFPDAVGHEEEWLKNLRESLKDPEYQWEYQLDNGRWVKSYNHVTREGGRVGIRVDVTELRDHQTQLEKSNQELQSAIESRISAERRFADIANISTDWFWEQDAKGRFTFLSDGFARATGIPKEKLIGKTRAEAFHDDMALQTVGDWDKLQVLTEKHVPFNDFIYTLIDLEGHRKSLRISGLPFYDTKGKFAGYRGVGSDVTILTTALHNAEESNRAKSEFLSIVSHELRTPLTVILGFNAFLKQPTILRSVMALRKQLQGESVDPKAIEKLVDGLTAEVRTYAEKIDVSGQQLLAIVNDILQFSSLEAGKVGVVQEAVPLDDFVAEIVNDFSVTVEAKNLVLTHETHGEKIMADRVRLRQVLTNLISNAIKFTDHGSINISTKRVGQDVEIRVRDTGKGIPEELQEAVFEQFKQADNAGSRREGGVGLGLSIVKMLVELQGGSVRLESKPGQGATFIVRFTAAADQNGTQRTPKRASMI